MTRDDFTSRERAQALMMAELDGEISATERDELDRLLAAHPDLSAEWRRFVRLKEVTAGMVLRHPPEEVWDRYWQGTYRRVERGIAWLLVSAGLAILAAYGLWHAAGALLQDTTTPTFVRLAIAAAGSGGVILVISVIRERLFTSRRDPYQKEVVR